MTSRTYPEVYSIFSFLLTIQLRFLQSEFTIPSAVFNSFYIHLIKYVVIMLVKGKGEGVPVTGRGGP
jgi:hypothetical protein